MATWVPVIVAVISAVLAGYYARQSRSAELQAQRILELERRVAASKGEIFEPMVEAVGRMWDRIVQGGEKPPDWAEKEILPHFVRFGHWVQIYGSDDSVRLYHRFMQAQFADAPSSVTMRLIGELILAARRELGHPATALDVLDLMGIRINDIYVDGEPLAWTQLPEDELYASEEWTPPWGDRFARATAHQTH